MDSWSPFSSNQAKVHAGGDRVGNPMKSKNNSDPILDEPVSSGEKKKKPLVDMSWLRKMGHTKLNLNRQDKVQENPIDSDGQNSIQAASIDSNDTYGMTDDDSSLNSNRSSQRSVKSLKELEDAVRIAQDELQQARRRESEKQYMLDEELRSRKRQAWDHRVAAAKEFEQKEEQDESRLLKQYQAPEVVQADFKEKMYAAKRAAEKAKFMAERREYIRLAMIPRKADAARCYLLDNESQCDRRPGCAWRSLQGRCDVDCVSIGDEQTCNMTVGIINNDQIFPHYNARESDEKLSAFVDRNYDISKICMFSRKNGCMWK